MRNLFVREKVFKNIENKAYCVQIAVNKGFNFLYSIFDISFKLFDDTHYFGFYFVLFGDLLKINISWTRRQDKEGNIFIFDIDFLWLMINLSTYDTRHWDDDNETWEVYDT